FCRSTQLPLSSNGVCWNCVDQTNGSCCFSRMCAGVKYSGDSGSPSARPTGSSSRDRKSTRLNSSHVSISYAVFCLKKKKLRTMLGCHVDLVDIGALWPGGLMDGASLWGLSGSDLVYLRLLSGLAFKRWRPASCDI